MSNKIIESIIVRSFHLCVPIFDSKEDLGELALDEESLEVIQPLIGKSWRDIDCDYWENYNWGLVFFPQDKLNLIIPSIMICSLRKPTHCSNVLEDLFSLLAETNDGDDNEINQRFFKWDLSQIITFIVWLMHMKNKGFLGGFLYQDILANISELPQIEDAITSPGSVLGS